MPKVSVLLTSFNHSRFIREAIDSVLRQTFADFELLILDDASTDDSWWIINSYRDPRIKAIRTSKKGEITSKVIDIISNVATGEYIAVHHSDDVWEADKLDKQVVYLDAHPATGAVFTDADAISEESLPMEGHFYSSIFSQPNRTRHEWLRHFFNHGNALCHPSVLIRKECFRTCGFYRPWLWQIDDFDMWMRLLMKYEIHVLPQKLTRFRVRNHEANVSGNHRTARIRNFYEYHRILDNYREIGDFDELCLVFPEARKYYRADRTDLHLALGLASLEVAIRPFAQLFALNLVQEALADPARAPGIKAAYDFDIGNLMELTGRYDVFSLEELAGINNLAAEHAQQLGDLHGRLSSDAEQIANFSRGVAERDSLILELDQKLSAHAATVASLTDEVHQRFAESTAQRSRIEELTRELVEIDGRFAEAARTIADSGIRAAVQDGEIRSLGAELAEKDGRIDSLGSELAEKDRRIDSLGADAAEKARLIDSLHAEVAIRDDRISDLQAALAEKDRHIGGLGAEAVQRDARIAALDLQIEMLQGQALRQAESTSSLQTELAQRDAAVQALVASHSWRVTRPLRLVGKLVRRARNIGAPRGAAAAAEPAMSAPAPSAPAALPSPAPPAAARPAPEQFDADFYLESNPDVAAAGVDPYVHFMESGAAEGRLATRPASIAAEPAPEPEPAPETAPEPPPAPAPGDPECTAEPAPQALPDPDFDEAYYLERYPDIRAAGIPAYEHFINSGRAEGRIGKRPELTITEGAHAIDPARQSVLVVSHEASRTGAPILSLNIASELQKRFNVVVLLLGGGELIADFLAATSLVVGPEAIRGEPDEADFVVAQLCARMDLGFAIVNSIESRVVLRGLAKSSIPTVNLIHEFAAYTRPRDAFPFAMHWAGETVFSTRITYENAIAQLPELAECQAHMLPQGRCVPPDIEIDPDKRAAEAARVKACLRPEALEGKKRFVVIGAGSVQYRKGVDLFMECAARVIRSPGGETCRFVWIGNGYDPEKDIGYSSYLAEQVRRAGIGQQFVFMPETPLIDHAYALADTMLLSSRLDPLPNVAIDAMSCGLPVVCFSGASGIADILEQNGLGAACVAPYHDTAAMAELVLQLARSPAAARDVGARMKQLADSQFNMPGYIRELEQLASAAGQRLALERESSQIIAESRLLDPGFFLRAPRQDKALDEIVRHGYVRSWATGIDKRKPRPGFHPHVYLENRATEAAGLDPFAAYLRAGQPEGPWNSELIRCRDPVAGCAGEVRTALHIHAYYPDLLPDMLERLGKNQSRPDLFISVPDEGALESARTHVQGYAGQVARIRVVPNAGRDLGPLLTAFGDELVANYGIVGHVHTKKSLDIGNASSGRTWHGFLMENLLGGNSPMLDIILGRMAADPSIGLVFPDDPHVVGWGENRVHAEALSARLGLSGLPRHPVFPVGSMFWARAEAIAPLVALKLDWNDYPPEPLPYDGSMLHAIERMLPTVATAASSRVVLTHVNGITR